ncbi:MAG: hypothetical protein ACKO25_13120 [Cyanobium sp.]
MAARPPTSCTPSLPRLAALLISAVALIPVAAQAQQQGYGQTLGTSPMEKQMFDPDPRGGKSGGSLLDSTNPLDLMNMIRRSSAMNDATPPASAIDQALKELDAQPKGSAAPAAPSSGLRLQGP